MSHTLRTLGLAALIAASASAFMTTHASALSMADCSLKFKAAKAAGTDGGLKWNDFRKAQCSTDAAAVPAAPVAKAAATPAVKVAAPAAPAAAVVATSGSFMKECSAGWKAMKAANTVPAGMTFKDFVAAKCVVAGAPAAAPAAKGAVAAAPAAPAAPMTKMTKTAAPTEPTAAEAPIKTVDKNGKPFTAGQLAFYAHEKVCGGQWRALSPKPVGMTWPQYLSACHKKMKAAGQ